MLNLKKTAAAVLALSSSAVFAGTMGPVCSAVNVTVPCESTAWDVGGRALYLQPALAGGGYNYVGVNNADRAVSEDNWGWGFMIEGSYHYETGSDANLNWYHFSKSSSRNFNYGNINSSGIFGTVTTAGTAATSLDPKWDAVNLEFGQHVDFGERKDIRFHGGVQFARLAVTATSTRSGSVAFTAPAIGLTNAAQNVATTVTRKPTYNGFGPRAGADMGYEWGNGLGIYANAAAALLAGSAKQSLSLVDNIGNNYSVSASKTAVVPELEAKLGLKYDYAVAQGDLTLDVGWMWLNYWNATQTTGRFGSNSGDFGLQGLYFGLKWLGNVA